jgi:hypothetical protein
VRRIRASIVAGALALAGASDAQEPKISRVGYLSSSALSAEEIG